MHRCWTHFAPLLCSAEHQIPRPKCLLLNKRSKEWLHTFCCKVLGLEEEDFSCEANMVPGVHRFLNLTAASASLQFCCHSRGAAALRCQHTAVLCLAPSVSSASSASQNCHVRLLVWQCSSKLNGALPLPCSCAQQVASNAGASDD